MIPSGGHHLPRDLNFFVSFVCSAWFAMFFAVFLFGLFGLPCFMQFVCSACFAMYLYLYCLASLPLFFALCLFGWLVRRDVLYFLFGLVCYFFAVCFFGLFLHVFCSLFVCCFAMFLQLVCLFGLLCFFAVCFFGLVCHDF